MRNGKKQMLGFNLLTERSGAIHSHDGLTKLNITSLKFPSGRR